MTRGANLVGVSFFDDFPQPPPPPERVPRPPKPWDGPPGGTIGGWVPWRIVLVRSDEAYALLRDFEAFPSGLHFELVAQFNDDTARTGCGPLHRRRGIEAPRIGVRFADGRKTATGPPRPQEPDGDPAYPLLRSGGGSGGGGRSRVSYWLWPLPPPGLLTWVSIWPEMGIGETSVEVDASVLSDAAAEAERLWGTGGNSAGFGYAPA